MVSLSIAGAIFQNRAIDNIVTILPGQDRNTLRSAVTGTDSTFLSSLVETERLRVIRGIVEALSSVYAVLIVAGATVFLAACFLPVSRPWLLAVKDVFLIEEFTMVPENETR